MQRKKICLEKLINLAEQTAAAGIVKRFCFYSVCEQKWYLFGVANQQRIQNLNASTTGQLGDSRLEAISVPK